MYASSIADALPLGGFYLIAAAIVLVSIELGWQVGNRRRQRTTKERKAPVSAAVGSTLGLLAFLLAFTFGMASARYDTRKQNALMEANSIGTTYLRADFLPAQARDEVRSLLREYTVLRAGGVASYMSEQGMERTADIHDKLWAISADAVKQSDSIAAGLYIQSLNETIDLDATRVAGIRNRIPDSIWLMLFLVTIFAMTALGYEFGLTGVHSWATMLLLVVVFTTVITLIADLDRPQAGLIQISQQPLIDLLEKINAPMP
jgi:hypothetical protein